MLKMNKRSIQLLMHVGREMTDVSRLREALQISSSQFNLMARTLAGQGYIVRVGRTIKAGPKYKHFDKIARRYDIQKMLGGSNEAVLCSITKPATIREIHAATGLSVQTIQRAMTDFESLGIIRRDRDRISIKQDDVSFFAKYLWSEKEPGHEVIYHDSQRVLQRTEKGARAEGELTGFSLFADYGMEYHTNHDFYIKQDFPLTIEDLLIHAVVSSGHNKNEIAMCILFYLRNRESMDTMAIRQAARMYGVSDIWLDIESYVRNNTTAHESLFLPRSEFEEKARLYDIRPELYALPDVYSRLFEDIGSKLETPVDVYLFGGENMRRKGIKPRTKDCDVIVNDEAHRREFVRALERMGYASLNKRHFTQDDARIDPFDILQHPERSRIDLFKTRIAGKLILSDRMIKRASHENFGRLNLYSLANEDLFLLKAVTAREGDIVDLMLIVQAGNFNWSTVWDELIAQEHDTRTNFSSTVLESIDYLHEQTGILPPFYRRLVRRSLDHEIKSLMRQRSFQLDDMIELLEGGDISEKMIRNRVDYLQRAGYLEKIKRGDKVMIVPRMKTGLNVYPKSPVDSNARMKEYIRRYSKQVYLSRETVDLALKYVDKITSMGGNVGRKPSGLAVAVLRVACEANSEDVRLGDLRLISGLSPTSFVKLYRHAKSYLV